MAHRGATCDVHDSIAFFGVARAPPLRGSAVDQDCMDAAGGPSTGCGQCSEFRSVV